MLSKIITFGVLAASSFKVSCAASPAAAGPEPTVAPKVVNGDAVGSRETYKFVVSLQSSINGYHFCGGSLLSGSNDESDYVVTAAHCVTGWSLNDAIIQVYRYDFGNKTEEYDQSAVEAIYIHEEYVPDRWPMMHDIALLKLTRKLQVRQRVYLDQGYFSRPKNAAGWNSDLTVAGWGKNEHGRYPNIMQEAAVPVVPWWRCKKLLGPRLFKRESMMCAGEYLEGGKDLCNGDSGGPLFAKVADDTFVLVGLSSWYTGECGDTASGYVSVKAYRDWIAEKTGTASYIAGHGLNNGTTWCWHPWCYDGLHQPLSAEAPSREDKSDGQSRRLDDTQTPVVV